MPTDLTDAERIEVMNAAIETATTTARAFSRMSNRLGEQPNIADSAMQAFGAAAAANVGPNGSWPTDFGTRITDRVHIYLLGAQRYLISMVALLQNYPNGLGLGAVARSIGEASGKAVWLLDNRLGTVDKARERVARLLLDEADEARRRKTISDGLLHGDRARAGDEYRLKWDRASKPWYFFAHEITVDKSGNASIRNQRFPTTSQFVVEAERILTNSHFDAQPVYAYLSALTHPTIFGYVESLAADDAVFYAKLANYSSLALFNGMRVYTGWTQADPEIFPEKESVLTCSDKLVELIDQFSID